ncbi:hypothetical protein DFH08DRAFT_817083 [Mycena albidolilacea]|uniref:Uncharacterized protein n=1 Tax=Mycena albidolilacea TaxID=1033008 RepID=A0AAD6ZJQ3_9AGAR|nr:hypothetical protein DFH08DRAFT_817083 [Mycena albidolilacea]
MVGNGLDLEIIAAGLLPSDFLGVTLPTPPPPLSPTPVPSPPAVHTPSPPPITVLEAEEPLPMPMPSQPSAPLSRKRARVWGTQVHSPKASKSSASQPEGQKPPTICIPSAHAHSNAGRDPTQIPRAFPSEAPRSKGAIICTLFPPCKRCNNSGRLCTLEVEHPLAAKTPRCCSPCKAVHMNCPNWTKFSNAYKSGDDEVLRGFQIWLWEHLGEGSYTPRHPNPWWLDLSQTHIRSPTVKVLSGSKAESSEDEVPTPKRRKTLCPHRPEMVEVTDEDDAPTLADDPQNYDLEEEDVQMPSLGSSIAADDRNYDSEQQVSFSRTTLDDPLPLNARFLGFRLQPVAEILTASHSSFVEEIVRQSAKDAGDKEQLRSTLPLISEVFGQAGRFLG